MSLPVLNDEALYGLPGRVVEELDPYTEASPVAVLTTFLTMFGSLTGPNPYIYAGGHDHPARLFVLLAGRSAKARKGTSLAEVVALFRPIAGQWLDDRMLSGFGSGEAIISQVADDNDRRALVAETEFARVLAVSSRKGSILSELIRQSWDSGNLQNLTKHESQRVTDAHVSVVGHITVDELRDKLTDVDTSNGFLNRFLVIGVGRSKRLPDAPRMPSGQHDALVGAIGDTLQHASSSGPLKRTPDASRLWAAMYNALADDDPPGMLGHAIARAETQVLRLSVAYAATDAANAIEVAHLEAAYELWRYSRTCAARLFPATADPRAGRLLDAIAEAGDAGMTGNEQRDVFSQHVAADDLDRLREQLESLGLVATETIPTGGRPRTVTRLTQAGVKSVQSGESLLDPTADPLPTLSTLHKRATTTTRAKSVKSVKSPPAPSRGHLPTLKTLSTQPTRDDQPTLDTCHDRDCDRPATAHDVDGVRRCDGCVSWNAEGGAA